MCEGIIDSNVYHALFDKISSSKEIATNFTYLQKSYFFKYYNKTKRLLPYKFHGIKMSGIYFLIFQFCKPINLSIVCLDGRLILEQKTYERFEIKF